MELIIDFYKSLDTLNLIIFWGIIIVIILLLIFSTIMINKNKKLKKIVAENNKYEEELPIKKEEIVTTEPVIEPIEDVLTIENTKESLTEPIEIIDEENKFVNEEQEKSYQQEETKNVSLQNNNYQGINTKYEKKQPIEMQTGPYQRNVLREMSLSQTSPIGINRQVKSEEKKVEMAKDLAESLNNEQIDNDSRTEKEVKMDYIQNKSLDINSQIKKEFSNIENTSPRKTEILNEPIKRETAKQEEIKPQTIETPKTYQAETKSEPIKIDTPTNELLNITPELVEDKEEKSSSEKYLEEVSRKLAEAEIPDEIERTDYELEQEENAIISYKELMEKKDSIQTVDEEEAIISIEELMNRNNKKQEENIVQESKLYNINESEENDDFIKELKQFRNDL